MVTQVVVGLCLGYICGTLMMIFRELCRIRVSLQRPDLSAASAAMKEKWLRTLNAVSDDEWRDAAGR